MMSFKALRSFIEGFWLADRSRSEVVLRKGTPRREFSRAGRG
jgi:hypothetical protein